MATTIKTVMTYPLDGSTTDFNIPFEYLARKFVRVTLIGVDRKELILNQDYRFATKTTISTTRALGPADGYTLIEIRRFTPATDRLVDFTDGSILRAYDLNISQVQTLHVAEEARDLTADTIGVNNDGHLDARGRRIVNLANAVDDRDAVPFGQLKTMNQNSWQARNDALQFRNEAQTFRNQAESFKTESGTNAANTKQWSDEAEGFRDEAEQFKNTSGQYAESAGSYAGNAKDSEDEARRIAASIKESGKIGYITSRSFEKGFNVTKWNEVLLWEEDGEYYRWDGTLPKNVPAGSTPETSGGIGLGAWVSVGDASFRSLFAGKDGKGLDDFYAGGGWTGSQAGSANLQGPLHTNAMRWRFDIKDSNSLDTVCWVEKETIATKGDTSTGDTGWDGGAAYFAVKKKSGDAPVNALTGYARHNGGSGGMIGVLGRGSGQVPESEVWGMWAYAEVGFGAADTGVHQAITLEGNLCNRGPDMGWMAGTGKGAGRGILSITADGSNKCTHAFYVGNHKASGGSPGTGGWWTGLLIGTNSIAANTNGSTTYVGDGEAIRINGSGQAAHAYGGLRFYNGSMRYGVSFKEASFVNHTAILMGAGQRINWGDHVGSSRWMGFDASINCLNLSAMGLSIGGKKVIGERVTGIYNMTGIADGSSKNTETVTLPELARLVKKILDALITTHGLMGPT